MQRSKWKIAGLLWGLMLAGLIACFYLALAWYHLAISWYWMRRRRRLVLKQARLARVTKKVVSIAKGLGDPGTVGN